jgi:hypothetical protein
VRADLEAGVTGLEQYRAINACTLQMVAIAVRRASGIQERLALGVDEDEPLVVEGTFGRLTVRAERGEDPPDSPRESPRSRVVGLVLVEGHATALEVQAAPVAPDGFGHAHALSMQEPVEHAPSDPHPRAAEELHVLVRVQVALGFFLRELRDEALGERIVLDDLERIDTEVEHAVHPHGNIVARTGAEPFGERLHDKFAVLDVELSDENGAHERIHVVFEPLHIAPNVDLHRHMILVVTREFVRGPLPADVFERRILQCGRFWRELAPADRIDGVPDTIERFAFAHARVD